MVLSKKILNFIIFIAFSTAVYFLIIKQIIYPTIIPMVIKGGASIFTDWTAILNANMCDEKGYDVFVENPCDQWKRIHVYGKALLYLPFIRSFPKFYFLITPILMNLLFIFTVISSLFIYEDKNRFFLLSFFIISIPVLLVVERSNIDLAIFITMYILAKNNNIILKHLFLLLATIIKFYPIVLSIVFLFEKNFKKIGINLLIFFSITILIFLFQADTLIKIFNNQGVASASSFGIYEFSFMGFVNLLRYLDISIYNSNYNMIKYLYVFLCILLPITLTFFYLSKKHYTNDLLVNLYKKNTFENKFYILSSFIILICYFSFSNFIYREIFFLGLIPWILKSEKKIKSNNFLTFYFYILFFKFFITTILVFLSRNKIFPNLDFIFIIIKHSIDLYLISVILYIFLFSTLILIKKITPTIFN